MKILIIHGPNLNLLGERETAIYGKTSLKEINSSLTALAKKEGASVTFFQSNSEGEIVDALQAAAKKFDAVVLNPAGFTHTSVAIADAVAAIKIPVVEVHLSNIKGREEFRKQSYVSPVAAGVVFGFGAESYRLGLRGALALAGKKKK
ncbi:MAG: type II 3-dehydroquinate dehydratase [bacterium]|nr:type II 3-dehydroquinate dehydratase [bacterium]